MTEVLEKSVLDEVVHKRLLADISAVCGMRLGEVGRPTRQPDALHLPAHTPAEPLDHMALLAPPIAALNDIGCNRLPDSTIPPPSTAELAAADVT